MNVQDLLLPVAGTAPPLLYAALKNSSTASSIPCQFFRGAALAFDFEQMLLVVSFNTSANIPIDGGFNLRS